MQRRDAGSQSRIPAHPRDDHNARQLIVAGLAHQRAGRLAEAEQLYTNALEREPKNSYVLYLRGTLFFQTGRSDAAIQDLRHSIELNQNDPWAIYILGMAFQKQGKLDDALVRCTEALRIKPNFYQALNSIGNIFQKQGKLDEAESRYIEALRIEPDYPDALINLGNVLQEQGKLDEAVIRYTEALRIKPDYPDTLYNLGSVFQKQGKLDEASERYTEALRIKPDYPAALNNLGNVLQEQGKLDEAVACYRTALDLEPDSPDAYLNLGHTLTVSGRFDEAVRVFETAIGLAPRRGLSYLLLAATGRIIPGSPYLRRMEELASDINSLPEADQMELHFALGAVYADLGDQERSFRHLLAGNRLKRRRIDYDEAETLALFDRIRAVFTAELLACGPKTGVPSPLPVFVVGMPRSGTTLVEQILASHPQVFGAGELLHLPHLVRSFRQIESGVVFPEAVTVLPRERLERLGAAYLDGLRAKAPSAARIVDKLPDNFLRIGLIHLALPQARIIHVRRDPVDTCLSCFSILFAGRLHYTYDLAELGRFYRAYEGLMAHWRDVLPPGVMLEVRYEDVVADLEGQARRILDHCGLAWDERCLAFHQNQRLVRTASAAQVRRPLYASSVGRWRVFADLARPLLDALRGERVG
jgi:tetratricopeptide (TPR) repeat protein